MIEVKVDSIRISLMSEHRVIMLKVLDEDRYLPIWIGPYEAEAIALRLQHRRTPRPLTHDLLKNMIAHLGGEVAYIVVNDMRNDTYYARILVDVDGEQMDIDSRPSDAIALAVRVEAPIFVEETVMDEAAITPEKDITEGEGEGDETLDAFRDFIDTLDLDDLPIQ